MPKCIFCKSTTRSFNTREHILPESLGGGDWAVLPKGLFCDKCQNQFGSTIEQQALADYPFSLFRVLMGIPTKKGKAPWMKSWEGIISGHPAPGIIGYEPALPFKSATQDRSKTVMRLVAHPIKPQFVCRTLLKMAIEVIAAHNPDDAFHEKLDEAREFALSGKKQGDWWYLQKEDIGKASKFLKSGVNPEDLSEGIVLETQIVEDGAEIFRLKLLYFDLIIPLERRIQRPDMKDLPEPEFRLFVV